MTTREPYSDGVTTPPTDAPAPPGTTAPDPSGLDLSDTANAALYPDVDHPDPEELPPDAFTVPPPIEQRESPLLDVVRAYATGQADWPTTKQALVDFPYAQNPPVAGSPLSTSGSHGEWWADVEANAGIFAADNTWAQLQETKAAGMLTRAEFNEVLAEKASRGQQAQVDEAAKQQDPAPGEGKAVPFDPKKHPRGMHGLWAHVPTARPIGGSMADAQDPIELPKSRRTTSLLPNNAIVRHEDGRVGRVRHVTVADLRTGHTLVNPVTGAHTGYVTDVHVRPAADRREQAGDRTPLGMDRFVSVDDEPHRGMGMGSRHTVFEPFTAAPPPARLTPDTRKQLAEAAVKMRRDGIDFDTAEGHFLGVSGEFHDHDHDAIMRLLDDAYDR